MGKVIKRIIIAIAVIAGVIVVALVGLTLKSHYDSLKPQLADDYYTKNFLWEGACEAAANNGCIVHPHFMLSFGATTE